MAIASFLWAIVLLFGVASQTVSAQVFVSFSGSYAGQIEAPAGLSSSCAATFNQTIVCDPTLWRVAQRALPSATEVQDICHTACVTSLEGLRESQLANCTDNDNITASYKVYPPTYITDLLLYAYSYTCVTDSVGNKCYPLFLQYNTGNDSSGFCSACNLETWQAVLNSPLGYNKNFAASYWASLTSSCKVTSYPVSSPTAYVLGTTSEDIFKPSTTVGGVTPTYTCESTYTIQDTDTCRSISRAKQVSTFYLLYANKLPARCNRFPGAGTELCIPQSCDAHTVAPWDTCESLASWKGVTIAQLVAWNPNLEFRCGNLPYLRGYVICLSEPGAVSTTLTAAPAPTTS